MKKTLLGAVGLAGLVVGATAIGGTGGAADHLDAPRAQSNPALDINDVYAFQSPTNPDNSVFIMTVNPLAGILSGTEFDERGAYRLHIDNDGDAKTDVLIPISFEDRNGDGTQEMRVHGFNTDDVGTAFSLRGGGTAWAGLADDPFFFDLAGFQDGLNFTGDDTLAGTNVSAIVLELPSSRVTDGDPNIGVWATTATQQGGGGRVDQVGRPAINTVLIGSDDKDAFNRTSTTDQLEVWGPKVNAAIAGLSSQANADALTPILLPDILTFDTSNPAGFLNGRGLADDVIDAELALLTEGALAGDGVDANDVPFLDVFPYLAPPHATGVDES
ncbi:MAG: DUF4331 family protein [Actinomycetota bacterium]